MKTRLLCFLLSIFVMRGFSQVTFTIVPNLDWATTATAPLGGLDPVGATTAIDRVTGHVYQVGYVTVSGQKDLYIVEFDSTGAQINQDTYDFAGYTDRALSLCITPYHIVVCGFSEASTGNSDIVTIEYDHNLNRKWVKRVAGTSGVNDAGNSVAIDDSMNVFVGGYVTQTGKGKDYVILKYDSAGTAHGQVKKNGNNLDDICQKIVVSGNQVYTTGSFHQSGTNNDVLTMSFNRSSLAVTWSVTTNGTASGDDTGNDIKIDGSNLVVCGSLNNSGTGDDYYYSVHTPSTGVASYTNTYDAYSGSDVAYSLVCDKLGDYAITGLASNGSNKEVHTLGYTAGSYLWTDTLAMNGSFTTTFPKVSVDTIAKYFYVCTTYSTATSSFDALLYQISPTGTKKWRKPYNSSSGKDVHTDLAVDGIGRIYTSTISETATSNVFAIKCLRYSQTPIYDPIDSLYESPNEKYLFYPNSGQLLKSTGGLEDTVVFMNTDVRPCTYFATNRISYLFLERAPLTSTPTVQRVDIDMIGSKTVTSPIPTEPAGPLHNIIHNSLPDAVLDLQGYRRYEIPNIYNGIDLHYYSNENGLKMYYVIKPFYEHSVSDIKWLIKGASTTTISDTYLKIGGFNDTVIFDAPYAYQVTTSLTCVPLTSAAWTQVGTDTFAITTSSYNPALPLVLEIDYGNTPISVASSIANLSQSTFYGSNRDDGIRDIDVDPVTGNFAALFGIDGYGMTHEFPATTGTLSIAADSVAGQCLGIVVFDKNEIRKTVNTYGVKARDLGPMSIALQGNLVTVVGNLPNFIDVSLTAPDNYSVLPSYTSTGPLTAGTYSNHGGPGFALQFRQDPVTGSANKLLWKTWLNGYASDMDKTPDGKFLYLTTSSSDGFTPHTKTKSGAYNNSAFPIYGVPSFQLWKFDSLGVEQWSSIFPAVNTTFHKATPMPVSPDYWNNGSGLNTLEWDEYPKCKIACDNYGFSLAGEVDTVGLLTFSRYGAPLTSSWGGGNDAFFARFNKSDSLVYCSYVSGANNEGYRAIAPLGSKEAVMVGYSNSKNKQKITTNPATGFYVDSTNTSNNYKILYTKFDTTGVKVHSTFYGANTSHVFAQGVTTDGGSRVFITGRDLGGFTLTVTNPANTYNVSARTSTEAFMLAFDWNQPIWNTEFGGAHEDIGTCLAYNPKMIDYASLILAGVTTSDYGSSDPPDFPIAASFVGGYFQEYHNSDFYYDMYSNLYVFPSTEADGFLAFFDQSKVIGIEEFFKDKTADIDIWNLFPNPTQNIAYVAFKTELKGDVKIEVRNQLGQLLHSEVRRDILAHTIVNLDTHGFKDGIYFVSLDNGQTLTTKKLVITK